MPRRIVWSTRWRIGAPALAALLFFVTQVGGSMDGRAAEAMAATPPTGTTMTSSEFAAACASSQLHLSTHTSVVGGEGTFDQICQVFLGRGVGLTFNLARLNGPSAFVVLGEASSGVVIHDSLISMPNGGIRLFHEQPTPANGQSVFISDSGLRSANDLRVGASVCGGGGRVMIVTSSLTSQTQVLAEAGADQCGGSNGAVEVWSSRLEAAGATASTGIRTGVGGSTVATYNTFPGAPGSTSIHGGARCESRENVPDVPCT